MLQELLNAFSRSASTAAFTNPAANGISGVPIKATFGNIFNNLLSSFSGVQQGTGGFQMPQQAFAGNMSPQAMQAFMNAQSQFGQTSKTLKNQAFVPGAVLVNSQGFPSQVPQFNQGFFPQQTAINPLQGFAGQAGAIPGSYGVSPYGNQYGGQVNPFMFPQSGVQQGSKLQSLLFPIISLFSFVKSLFSFRGSIKGLQPIKVDRENISYNGFQKYIDQEYEDGGFDEPAPYEGSGFSESENHSLSQALQNFN